MRRHEWTDVDRCSLLTATILTGTFTPELSGMGAECHYESAVLGFDVVRKTPDADDVAVGRIGPDVFFVDDRHLCPSCPYTRSGLYADSPLLASKYQATDRKAMVRIGQECTLRLDIVTAQQRVIVTVGPMLYARGVCEEAVTQPPA